MKSMTTDEVSLVFDNNNPSGATSAKTTFEYSGLLPGLYITGNAVVEQTGTGAITTPSLTIENSTFITSGALTTSSLTMTGGSFTTTNDTINVPDIILDNSSFTANKAVISVSEITLGNSSAFETGTLGVTATTVTIDDNSTFIVNGTNSFENLILTNNSTIQHWSNSTSQSYILDINITGDLTIDSTSSINADGKGYEKEQGPGKGARSNNHGTGAGHGGRGGGSIEITTNGAIYDSLTDPSEIGSGGGNSNTYGVVEGGAGGGGIRLNVGGTVINDGTISANGDNGAYYNATGGGGSGGFINLNAGVFAGSGTITANGGNGGNTSYAGGGGGGRIGIFYNSNSFAGDIKAAGASGYQRGGVGTVYMKSMTTDEVSLVFDNNNPSGATSAKTTFEYSG
ncbi:MAG: hypothetical protein GY869_01910, partial [Planctomycetes bacterium]|nr:hypothetical protein [Planctomycetota bacterium]